MSEVPDWIRQRNAANERAAAEANERSQQAIEASMLVAKQGPEVWQRFIKALAINAKALAELKGENLFGSTTPIGTPGSETSCQVNVDWRNTSESGPELRVLVFHYDRGTTGIRVTLQSWKETDMPFRIQHDSQVGIEYDGHVFTPEKAAERIIHDMAKSAKKRAA